MEKVKHGSKGGRPKIEFDDTDWKLAENMARIHCTGEEIAGCLGIGYDTLIARIMEKYGLSFPDWHKQYQAAGKMSLRREQFRAAERGNAAMLIWLGKQYLGQVDRVEHGGQMRVESDGLFAAIKKGIADSE